MQEDTEQKRCTTPAVAPRPAGSASIISTLDIDRAIQTVSANFGRAPKEVEIAEELCIDLKHYRQVLGLQDLEVADSYTGAGEKPEEETVGSLLNEPQKVPLFPSRFGGSEEIPRSLPDNADSPQSFPDWLISAPDIERAIRTLYATCGRAPTEVEIAEELRIDVALYRESLNHLKDLEIGLLHAERNADSDEEWIAYQPDGPEGDLLFRCLRSEMQALFKDAISKLPRMERLVITFHYYEYMYDKTISLILELPDSTVSSIRTSALLHLRAALPNPYLRTNPVAPHRLPGPRDGSICKENDGNARIPNRDEAHVSVYGSQKGLLPDGRSPQCLDDRSTWRRDFRSWYWLDDEQTLTQLQRQEQYRLKVDLP
jgi:DNA-directed RNA polymerase specialized sigma subunit